VKKINSKPLFISIFIALTTIILIQINKPTYPITTINSYEQALPELQNIDSQTLVLFDVDDTLITSQDALARTSNFPWNFKLSLFTNYPWLINSKNFEMIWSKMWQQAPRVLIEPDIVSYIHDMQDKHAIVLALTSMESGSYGVIKNMPEWRYAMLKNMGIVFSKQHANTTFTKLPTYRNHHPVLYNGILCANQQNKGLVLDAFLIYCECKPSKIISFDDDINALKAIGKTCKKYAVSFVLFHYKSNKLPNTWSSQKALQQFKYLIDENRWVHDIDIG